MTNVLELLQLDSIGSCDLGYIKVAEYQKNIPFEIKRVYWTYYTPNQVTRGHVPNKALEKCIFAVSGKIEFELINLKYEKLNLAFPEWKTINKFI